MKKYFFIIFTIVFLFTGIVTCKPEPPSYSLKAEWLSSTKEGTITKTFVSGLDEVIEMDTITFVRPDKFKQMEKHKGEFNQIIVKFKDEYQVGKVIGNRNNIEKFEKYGKLTSLKTSNLNFGIVKPNDSKDVNWKEMVEYYDSLPEVEYAEPDYKRYIFAFPSDPPNDSFYTYQWHLKDIGMEPAWAMETGDSSIVVAVIDSGLYTGAGMVDTPINVDTTNDYDFANNDNDPSDDNGHGTHVSGTIAQATNNSTGTSGMAPDVTILPIKVTGANGTCWISDVINGINHAKNQGADIINMSLGSSSYAQSEYDAVKDAYNAGIILFGAAGNENTSVIYPAAHTDYVVAVGATRYDKTKSYYSCFGPELDIVAPGGDVTVDQNNDSYSDGVVQETINGYSESSGTTDYTPNYIFYQGTSMASPHAAGLAALMKSYRTGATNIQIEAAIKNSATDLGNNGFDNDYGYGIINPVDALNLIATLFDNSMTAYQVRGSKSEDYTGTITKTYKINVVAGNIRIYLAPGNGNSIKELILLNSSSVEVASSTNGKIEYDVGATGGTYTIKFTIEM